MANFGFEIVDDVPDRFSELVLDFVRRDRLVLLSGGHTILDLIKPLHSHLAADLSVVPRIGQIDERLVLPSSHDSNWRTIEGGLSGVSFKGFPIISSRTPTENRILEEDESAGSMESKGILATSYARRYQQVILENGPLGLAHLGLGLDGHTASLFPGSAALAETERLVTVSSDPSGQNSHLRVTCTLAALNSFELRVVVALGLSKSEIVQRAIHGSGLPIHRLNPDSTVFLLDREAGSLL